jgi:hypothetical protein
MNRRQAFYLAAGSACIIGSLAFGDGATSATIKSEAPQRIAVRPTPRLSAVAVTNPFVALAAASASVHAPSVPQPIGPVIDAPRNPGMPQPGVVPQTSAGGVQVVLCATWDSAKDGRIPTAVFYVGNDSVVAGPGDDVGGYTLASVERDGVHFRTGESLSIADCDKLGQSSSDANSGEASVPQTNTVIPPDAMMPQAVPTAPSAGPDGPIVPAPAATPFSESSTIQNTYGSSSSAYGTSVYGEAPPSSPPLRIPPQLYRPPQPGVPQ